MLDKPNIIPLNWDSDFFGIPIGLIDISSSSGDCFQKLKEVIDASPYNLIYIFCDVRSSIEEVMGYVPEAEHVDCRVSFIKEIKGNNIDNKEYSKDIFSIKEISDQLYKIVVQAGEYSRFAKDKKFPPGAYERLYKTWLEKSIERTICDEVFVWADRQEELGLITLGIKNGRANVGLLGVEKHARGRGIGSKLLMEAEKYAVGRDAKQLHVVTQKQNLPACRLYEKAGFYIESLVNVFHLWKKK
jgi:dTDP-4-amino-4,6-dideoxy-D-galactose acyltransferase